MTVRITYFVHGTTTDNEKGIFSGTDDVELSALGIQQSAALPSLVADKQFDAIFCSDLVRAVHTAHLAFEGVAPIIADARLRECNYGIYNSKPVAEVEPLKEAHITEKFPEGESYDDAKARIASFLADLKKNYDGKHIAIVAHQAPQLALDVIIKHKTWQQAFAEDWRHTKAWQPGWEYVVE